MSVRVTAEQIRQLAPTAEPSYREAFLNGQPVLDQCGISTNPLRVAHFIAQVLYESRGLTVLDESHDDNSERLSAIWPSRADNSESLPTVWPSRLKPAGSTKFANREQLLNQVYADRLGNSGPNDGFMYRGRGLLQLTGKANYQEVTLSLRAKNPDAPDLVVSPDLVFSAQWCLAIAAVEWASKGCNAFADEDDIRKVTRAIKGGLVGLSERAR